MKIGYWGGAPSLGSGSSGGGDSELAARYTYEDITLKTDVSDKLAVSVSATVTDIE